MRLPFGWLCVVGVAFVPLFVAELEQLDVAVGHFREMRLFDEDERASQQIAHLGPVAARRGHAEYGALPGVLSVDFRDRDVEAIAQPPHDRADDTTLFLERLRPVDVQLDDGGADDHESAGRVSWISYGSITSPTFTSL
jgi:hypothetical protein